ncbi:MAG: hypothetical protein SFW66_08875 [Gammaproteobacteria bacterium]|nr:hypothetical protein [Gammaproteobacteria bacterium]
MLAPQTITFENLRGINTKKSRTQRLMNESNMALNGYLDTTGSFIKRKGFLAINPTEISTNFNINSIYQFNDEMIVAGSTNELISYDLTTDSETVLSSTITGSFYDFEEFLPLKTNYLFLTNGMDYPKKYDGTDLTQLSIDPPSTLPTATASNAGGTLTASSTYLVSITFLRDDGSGEIQESNPCKTGSSAPFTTEVSVTLGAADNRIALTNIPTSSDPQVTGRNVYVTRPNGSILYKAGAGTSASIANNTSTTYNITSNVDVLINQELEYNHDPAPKCYLIEKYNDRLLLAGDPVYPGRVYVSLPNNIWYFPQGILDESDIQYFDIGETVTSIKSYYDLVFIFGDKGGMFIFQGNDPSNFVKSSIKNDQIVTALSDRATIVQDNWCYFLSYDGYYRTNGQIIQKMSEPITSFFDPQNQFNEEFNVYGFSYGFNQIVPCAIYYKNLNVILIWITQANQNDYVNNICFVLHLSNISAEADVIYPNYTIYTNFATRTTSKFNVDNNYKYFLVSQSDGFVFESETGNYDGASINSTATSATSNTLTDSTQSWTVNAFAQIWCIITSGTGVGQSNIISSNTSDTLTFSNNWEITPDASSTYSIGGIFYEYTHSYTSYGDKNLSKRLLYTRPRFVSNGASSATVSFGYDFSDSVDIDPYIVEIGTESLWDVALWDEATWDSPVVKDIKIMGKNSRIHRWATVKISNYYSDQPVQYDGHDKIFQIKGTR